MNEENILTRKILTRQMKKISQVESQPDESHQIECRKYHKTNSNKMIEEIIPIRRKRKISQQDESQQDKHGKSPNKVNPNKMNEANITRLILIRRIRKIFQHDES